MKAAAKIAVGSMIQRAIAARVRGLMDGGDTITAVALRARVSRAKLSNFVNGKADMTTRAASRVAAVVGLEMR